MVDVWLGVVVPDVEFKDMCLKICLLLFKLVILFIKLSNVFALISYRTDNLIYPTFCHIQWLPAILVR